MGAGKHLQEKCTKISVPTGGEKENRETEYGGRTDNPGFPFKPSFLVFLLGKRYPEKVVLGRLGHFFGFLIGKGTPKKVVILRRLGQEKVQQESQKAWE